MDSTAPTLWDQAFTTFTDAVIIYRIRCFPCLLCRYRKHALVYELMRLWCVSATGAKADRSASYVERTLVRPEALFPVGTPYSKLHFSDGCNGVAFLPSIRLSVHVSADHGGGPP